MNRYEIYDVETEDLLADFDDLLEARTAMEHLAQDLAAGIEAQLAVNGEGHPGGIGVAVAMHDAVTGELLAAAGTCTGPVPGPPRRWCG